MENKNKIEEYMDSLPTEVRNVIKAVLEVELEKLEMHKPKGIKKEIKSVIRKEIKNREA